MSKAKKLLVHNMLTRRNGVDDEDIILYAQTPEFHYDVEHMHSHHEFVFVERGSLLNVSEGRTVKLVKNDIVIMRPECAHKIMFDKKANYLFFNLEINSEFLEKLLLTIENTDINSAIPDKITYLHCSDDEGFELMQLVNFATKYPIGSKNRQFYLKLLVLSLLTKCVVNVQSRLNDTAIDSPVINTMITELNKSENFLFSTNQICQKLNYSQEYVIRLFKSANLDTPNKIFLKNKLNYACTYLKTSSLKIVDIAEMCGIYTVSYFNKAFKKEFGVSPSQYRKKSKMYAPEHFVESND